MKTSRGKRLEKVDRMGLATEHRTKQFRLSKLSNMEPLKIFEQGNDMV